MKSILIIDASASIAILFAEIFERRGWSVSTCVDRECAMERLAGSESYDAVLLSQRVSATGGVKLIGFDPRDPIKRRLL